MIPLERIQKKDWLNVTKDIKKVQMEIIEAVAKVTADLEVLNGMETDDFTPAVRAKYMETLDITAALACRKSLQAASDAFKQAEAPQVPMQEKAAPAPAVEPTVTPAKEERVYALRLALTLTRNQSVALKKFLEANGIKYEKI